MATYRQYAKSAAAVVAQPTPSPSPAPFSGDISEYYITDRSNGGVAIPTPSVSITPSPTPPISPSVSTTPSATPSAAWYAIANVYRCNINSVATQVGECGDYLGLADIYRNDQSYIFGAFYTGSDPSLVYQPTQENKANNTSILVKSDPLSSCNQACKPASCSSGSIVTYSKGGFISYVECDGSTVYVDLNCSGSYTINPCHICTSITGSTGPLGSGTPAIITDIKCGFDCNVPPTPSVTPSRTPSSTPSITPSITKTPSVTPTPTPSVSLSIVPSPSTSPIPPVSPSCTCPTGYVGTYDGTQCVSSSTATPTPSGANPTGSGNKIWYGGSAPAWGVKGVRIFSTGSWDQFGALTAPADFAYQTSTYPLAFGYIYPIFPNTGSTPDLFWANRLNTIGVWDSSSQYWPGVYYGSGDPRNVTFGTPPYSGFLGVCKVLTVPTASTYYFGIGGDNRQTLKIDGNLIFDRETNTLGQPGQFYSPYLQANFEYWSIYPITLSAGPHLIEVGNWNYNEIGSFGCEIYNNTLNQLTSATTESALNIVWSTGEFCAARTPQYFAWFDSGLGGPYDGPFYPAGPSANQYFCTSSSPAGGGGWTCPPGFTLDLSNPQQPICRRYDYITVPCNPSVTPSISISNTPTPTPSVTPTVTPSISGTPCPTVSVTPTPSISVTPSPSPDCLSTSCNNATITNSNSYFYYTCQGVYVTGSNNLNARVCVDTSREYSSNLAYFYTGSPCECCPPNTFHPYRYFVASEYISGSTYYPINSASLSSACSASAKLNASEALSGSGWDGHADLSDLIVGSSLYYAQSSCRTGSLNINGYYPYKQTTNTGTTWKVAEFLDGNVISKPACCYTTVNFSASANNVGVSYTNCCGTTGSTIIASGSTGFTPPSGCLQSGSFVVTSGSLSNISYTDPCSC